jgi:hypothetical protein
MKRLAVFVALCLAVVAGFPWAYRLLYPIYVCRYRMTVDLVMGGRHYSGSSVAELRVKMQPRLLVPPLVAGERGEATVVDLGDGRALVAQLGYPVVFRAFNLPNDPAGAAQLPLLRGERRLAMQNLPTLVFFSDVNDPLSVKQVNPSALRETLGLDAQMGSVTVSITNDPITQDIEQKLPFLGNGPLSDGDPRRAALVTAHLGRSYFIRNDP